MTPLPLEASCGEVYRLLDSEDDVLLLDCREAEEHQLVSIQGATLLPMSELSQRREELAGMEHRSICVYCHHGMRSAQVAAWLRQEGFSRAVSMAGGIDAWALEIEPGMLRY